MRLWALNFINILIKNSDVANWRSCSSRDSEVPPLLCSRIVAEVSPVGAVASRWVCEPWRTSPYLWQTIVQDVYKRQDSGRRSYASTRAPTYAHRRQNRTKFPRRNLKTPQPQWRNVVVEVSAKSFLVKILSWIDQRIHWTIEMKLMGCMQS